MSAFSPSDLIVSIATPAQRLQSWTLSSAAWAPPLSTSEYITRETLLSSTAMMQTSLTFVAVLASAPTIVVASCEALRKECLMYRTTGIHRATAFGIASVYTNPAYRRRQAAAILLRHVQQHLDEAGAAATMLYSDIGREYYARLGWTVHSTTQAIIAPGETVAVGAVRMLADADIPSIAARTEDVLAARLAASAPPSVLVVPTAAQLAWTLRRADLMARFFVHGSVGADEQALQWRGAESATGRSWMVWEQNVRDGKLKVLVFVVAAGDEEEAAHVVRAAEREARSWDLKKIEVWNVQDKEMAVLKDTVGDRVSLVEREDSIPSLRWKGGEQQGEGEWVGNEYYAWC